MQPKIKGIFMIFGRVFTGFSAGISTSTLTGFSTRIFAIFAALFLAACSQKVLDYEPKEVTHYTPKWYANFAQPQLDNLLAAAEVQNEDLATAAVNLKIALANAQIDLPDLSLTASGSSSRDLSTSAPSKREFSTSARISYELDIYGKNYDNYRSKKWLATASQAQLDALRLTIYNSLADAYFNALYLYDTRRHLQSHLQNLTDLHAIITAKYRLGKAEILELRQSSQNITDLKNQLLSAATQLATITQTIKDLSASDPDLSALSLAPIPTTPPDLNTPFTDLAHRPDIAQAIANINASFYGYKATQKELLPSISLAGSLSDSDGRAGHAAGFNILGGAININLPFLNYLQDRPKYITSELEFDSAMLAYQKVLRTAANEAIKYAQSYALDLQNYENTKLILGQREQIVQIYEAKYAAGKAELKDLLDAKNMLLSAQTTLLNQKYKLLQSEIGFYKAIAK